LLVGCFLAFCSPFVVVLPIIHFSLISHRQSTLTIPTVGIIVLLQLVSRCIGVATCCWDHSLVVCLMYSCFLLSFCGCSAQNPPFHWYLTDTQAWQYKLLALAFRSTTKTWRDEESEIDKKDEKGPCGWERSLWMIKVPVDDNALFQILDDFSKIPEMGKNGKKSLTIVHAFIKFSIIFRKRICSAKLLELAKGEAMTWLLAEINRNLYHGTC